jgi:hypothetical protein
VWNGRVCAWRDIQKKFESLDELHRFARAKLVGTETTRVMTVEGYGSWRAGESGFRAGLMMPGLPMVGASYYQESCRAEPPWGSASSSSLTELAADRETFRDVPITDSMAVLVEA